MLTILHGNPDSTLDKHEKTDITHKKGFFCVIYAEEFNMERFVIKVRFFFLRK